LPVGRCLVDQNGGVDPAPVASTVTLSGSDLQTFGSPGNGAQQGGAPYNPSLRQDGAVGPMVTVGAAYTF
jgi:hypothetical protein